MVAVIQDMLSEKKIQMVMAVFMDQVIDEIEIIPVKTVNK
jgi:hypothetical protein